MKKERERKRKDRINVFSNKYKSFCILNVIKAHRVTLTVDCASCSAIIQCTFGNKLTREEGKMVPLVSKIMQINYVPFTDHFI